MISLNYRDSRPIYEQIKDGLRKLMVTGALQPDEKLPSVRALAAQLAINPNTIQRAYNQLESEGYVYSIPGKGSFAAVMDDAVAARKKELLKQVEELLRELRSRAAAEPVGTPSGTGGPVQGGPVDDSRVAEQLTGTMQNRLQELPAVARRAVLKQGQERSR